MNYSRTIFACFVGYISQAIVNNFLPLLFLTLSRTYDVSLGEITLLVTFNFGVQFFIDLASAKFVDKIGYRPCILVAHIFSFTGLVLLAFLPELFGFGGMLVSVCVYAVGGGLIEVLISPIMESCPTPNKEKAMSLLHSFYCWGHVAVVLLSTLFFETVGIEHWKILCFLWAIVPLFNTFLFASSPIAPLLSEGETGMGMKELFSNKTFWLLFVMMLCAGASELTVSQWSSTFAERGLGVSKTIGDLAGTTAFAVLMGTSRAIFGKFGDKLNLKKYTAWSIFLCVAGYFAVSLVPNEIVGLIGCGVIGFSVGILWPGTFSHASKWLPKGGTAMFALLALAGDVGGAVGPTVAGFVSSITGDNLRLGILVSVVFPIVFMICIFGNMIRKEKKE